MLSTLASATGSCFWSCMRHTGMPVDHIEALGGIQTYISDPPAATNKMILFLADFYGPLFVKNQLLPISRLAAISSLDPITSLVQEARKPAIDAFPAWLDAVKAKYVLRWYCFGAPVIMDLCSARSVVAGALATLHASTKDSSRNLSDLSCSPAQNDFAFPHASYRRAEDIMVSRKCTYYFQAFSGVKHRFAVRGGTNIETERWAKEESARGIKEWFDRFTA